MKFLVDVKVIITEIPEKRTQRIITGGEYFRGTRRVTYNLCVPIEAKDCREAGVEAELIAAYRFPKKEGYQANFLVLGFEEIRKGFNLPDSEVQ